MRSRHWLLLIVSLFFLIWNLFVSFNGDVWISFGGAFQADFWGSFPRNVYDSWNMRGIGYKYYLYLLYKIVSPVASPAQPQAFYFWVKLVHYLFMLPLGFFAFRNARKWLQRVNVDWLDAFFVFLLSVATFSYRYILEPEDICVYLSLAMMGMALSGRRLYQILSAFFIPLLLSMKLITVLYGIHAGLLVVFLFWFCRQNDKGRFIRFIGGCAGAAVFTVLFYRFVIPLEIEDTQNAILYQSSFTFKPESVKLFIIWYLKAGSHAPILFVGLLAWLLLLINNISRIFVVLLLLAAFGVPALAVILQDKYFIYHYMIFVPFSLACTFLAAPYVTLGMETGKRWLYVGSFIVFVWAIVQSPFDLPIKDKAASYGREKQVYLIPRARTYNTIDSAFNLSAEPSVLFLEDGALNFFIRSKSYSRYYYPLPLQRVHFSQKLRDSEVFKKEKALALAYTGKYVVLQPFWQQLQNVPELEAKLRNEYEVVYNYKDPVDMYTDLQVLRRK